MIGNTPRTRPAFARRWAAFSLFVAIFAGSWAAQDEAKSPEPLESELIGIRNVIINASAKLKNDIVGTRSHDSGVSATPAESCCAWNLQKIEKRLRAAERILGDFDRCYSSAGNQDMVLAGRVARADLIAFAKATGAFVKAPTKAQAQGALDAMTRTYNLLRETAVSLEPCEGLESQTPPEDRSRQSEDPGQSQQPRKD